MAMIAVEAVRGRFEIRVTAIDLSLLLLLSYEIVNYFLSSYRPNSILFLTQIVTVFAIFFVWAVLEEKSIVSRPIGVAVTFYGGLLALATILQFANVNAALATHGFEEAHHFKRLLGYFHFPVNSWSTILFLFFVPSCSLLIVWWRNEYLRYSIGFICLVLIIAMILTFSRGIYVSLVLFFVMTLIFFVRELKGKLKGMIAPTTFALLLLIVALLPVYKPVSGTFGLLETTSQIRSASGRLDLMEEGFAMVKNEPLFGIGSGNFAMKYPGNNSTRDKERSIILASVNNTALQLLIDKGVIGWIFYLLPFLSYIASFYTLMKDNAKPVVKAHSALFLSGIFAFAVKEMTFCSLLSSQAVLLLITIWFALSRTNSRQIIKGRLSRTSALIIVFPMVGFLGWINYKIEVAETADNLNKDFIVAVSENRLSDARAYIDRAIEKVPGNAIYHLNKGLLIMTSLDLFLSVDEMFESSLSHSRCPNKEAVNEFLTVLELNPNDPLAAHSLGWLAFHRGDCVLARHYFERANLTDPTEPLFNISKALLHAYESEDSLSIVHFARSVKVSPAILEGILWTEMKTRFPGIMKKSEELAVAELRTDFAESGSPVSAARLAKILMQVGKGGEAKSLLYSVTAEMPNMGRPWLYLGDLQVDDGPSKEMAYTKAMFIDEGDYLPKLRLAVLYESRFEFERAIIWYRRAVSEIIRMPLGSTREKIFSYYKSGTIVQPMLPKSIVYASLPIDSAGFYCQRLGELYECTGNKELAERFFALADISGVGFDQIFALLNER